ncbi:Protein of unknown function [Nocardioides exalbidus]|uniref:DUF4328 domain-containing protein n=1 Tax=Nocardioides exalbidus TaxID=402596 RepID=A0A1H4TLL7_9ACTN|nr:DUF4328 domain-containing protein [Nocardioides exalbidus]SEC57148.1 Protein of unknown function [Nocardioides exalbidus]
MSTQGAGWYADPQDGRWLRWWDGSSWTEHLHPLPPATAAQHPDLPRRWGLLSVLTQLALAVMVLLCAYGLWVDRQVLAFDEELRLRPDTLTVADGERIDALLTSTFVVSAWMLVTGVLVISWLYTAHRSNRMDRSVVRHASGWAVGGWFVPVLNFWRPFQMVTDVRRGATGDPRPGIPFSQGWWWGLFAGQYVLSWAGQTRASLRAGLRADTSTEAPPLLGFSQVAVDVAQWHQWQSVVTIAAGLLAVVVVRNVTRLVMTGQTGQSQSTNTTTSLTG